MDTRMIRGPVSCFVDARAEDFDPKSGSIVERLLFGWRPAVISMCLLITTVLGWEASHVRINANFFDGIPTNHPFMTNLLAHYDDLAQQGNTVRVIVEADRGTILDPGYLQTLENLSNDISALPGVETGGVVSLWAPTVRWTAVTEDGFDGGTIIPEDYDGSSAAIGEIRQNLAHSDEIGKLVATDFRSSVIIAPLNEVIDDRGTPLNYGQFSRQLEALRHKYATKGVILHIIGYAKVVGDIINAASQIITFFIISIIVAVASIYIFTRCVRSTLLVVLCSLIAVVWQIGLIVLFGLELDPYTEFVPFLIFAIGVSHGAQKMNGIIQDTGRGAPRRVAARMTFRRLFMVGCSALVCDALGFAFLFIIPIVAIKHLAMIASLGVAVLIFTNLILLPLLFSYIGVSTATAERAWRTEVKGQAERTFLWDSLVALTMRRWASMVLIIAVLLGGLGLYFSQRLQVGDLGQGAPELDANSQYNRDSAYSIRHYSASTDVFELMVTMPAGLCDDYGVLRAIDYVGWATSQVPGVVSIESVASLIRFSMVEISEQNLKWYELPNNQPTLNDVSSYGTQGLTNDACTMDQIMIYLKDHRAKTLLVLTAHLQSIIANVTLPPGTHILLAGGSAGIAAAVNETVSSALNKMLFFVYASVAGLCMIVFRSWRAVLCAILPLILTSVLAESLMAALGIGITVATLPMMALGVGIGVDYALYVLSIILVGLKAGESLQNAYRKSLNFTGRVVLLTGFTLGTSVSIWFFSTIKFQADMGILLAFMFLSNMMGALLLLPAMAHFLLKTSMRPSSAFG
jgi:predicted RND superfamily exporter protein